MIDDLDSEIDACEKELRSLGADHPYVSLLQPALASPGSSVHDRLGDRRHLTLLVSEEADGLHRALPARLPVRRQGLPRSDLKERAEVPALVIIEAAVHASSHPVYRDHYDRTKARLGRQRGAKIARIEVARKLAEAIWHMLQTGSMFAPARSPPRLWSLDDPRLRWTSRSSPTRPFPPSRRR